MPIGLTVLFILAFITPSPLLRAGPESRILGRAGTLAIRASALLQARRDLDILNRIGLGNAVRVVAGAALPGEKALIFVARNDQPDLCWLLLSHEARKLNIHTGATAVDDFVANSLGLKGDTLAKWLSELRTRGILEKEVRQALGNYLCIAQAFDSSNKAPTETEDQLQELYADMFRIMDAAMLEFKAADYLAQAPEPTDKEVAEQFEAGKLWFRDALDNPTPFKFGYRLPDRVQVEYALVDTSGVLAATEVDLDKVFEYWDTHKDEFTKPAQPDTTSPASMPIGPGLSQSQPARITTFAEAKPLIQKKLREAMAEDKVRQIADGLLTLIRQIEDAGGLPPGKTALQMAAEQMLNANQPVRYFRSGKLIDRQAIAADAFLGGAVAGEGPSPQSLGNIAFSLKEFHPGEEKWVPSIEVGRAYPRAMSLAGPSTPCKLVWAVVAAAPAEVPQDLNQVRDQVIMDCKLGHAYEVALAKAKEAMTQAQISGLTNVAQPLGKEVIDAKDMRRRVLADPAEVSLPVRYVRMSVWQMQQWIESGRKGPRPPDIDPRLAQQVALFPPVMEFVGMAPVAQSEESRRQFLSAVFDKLTPSGSGKGRLAAGSASRPAEGASATSRPIGEAMTPPTTQPVDVPAPADAIMVVGLPVERSALVVQRVKYTPAYEDGYREVRPLLMGALQQMRLHELMLRWYDQKEIFRRTGFTQAPVK
jgi:hypothetical protein